MLLFFLTALEGIPEPDNVPGEASSISLTPCRNERHSGSVCQRRIWSRLRRQSRANCGRFKPGLTEDQAATIGVQKPNQIVLQTAFLCHSAGLHTLASTLTAKPPYPVMHPCRKDMIGRAAEAFAT